MLGLLQLLWLLSTEEALPGWCVINQVWREQRGADIDSFPLAIVSINFTCLAFDAFVRGKLAGQIESSQRAGADMSVIKVHVHWDFLRLCCIPLQRSSFAHSTSTQSLIIRRLSHSSLLQTQPDPLPSPSVPQHVLRRLLSLHGDHLVQAPADHRKLFRNHRPYPAHCEQNAYEDF